MWSEKFRFRDWGLFPKIEKPPGGRFFCCRRKNPREQKTAKRLFWRHNAAPNLRIGLAIAQPSASRHRAQSTTGTAKHTPSLHPPPHRRNLADCPIAFFAVSCFIIFAPLFPASPPPVQNRGLSPICFHSLPSPPFFADKRGALSLSKNSSILTKS